ncbi:MAG TPA: asparagine synthase-related protein [Thermoplasmata archaeon]
MEGIAGTYGITDFSLVKKMLAKLVHRGPKQIDLYSDEGVSLGARRTSAPTARKTPAIAQGEGVAVASDSYMFNKEFLRRTIAPSLAPGASDAELVLAMYNSIGPRMLSYIDGAYAVVVVDRGKTLLARDPYGLKPLYISGSERNGAYSSEMKSQMMYSDVFQPFPPGRMFTTGEGFKKIVRRAVEWSNGELPREPCDQVRALLISSVQACAEESRGLNILLSGGIDSSVVAAAAAEISSDIRTVCVGMDDSEDLRMARLVSRHLGTKHTEGVFGVDDMLKVLDQAIYYAESFDYPLVRSCIPNFMAAHMFTHKDRVTLCGEGGDEIFAGYDFLRGVKGNERLRKERMALLATGHLTGFQRVDRMTASASLDGRMPLMSNDIIACGLKLDRKELIGPKDNQAKLVLRKAFEDLLPHEVVWRRKRRFSEGAGSINSLIKFAETSISNEELEKARKKLPSGRLRTKEELLYFRAFERHFPSASAISAVGLTLKP